MIDNTFKKICMTSKVSQMKTYKKLFTDTILHILEFKLQSGNEKKCNICCRLLSE